MEPNLRQEKRVTATTPLTIEQQRFLKYYIQYGEASKAYKEATGRSSSSRANAWLKLPNIQAEINKVMKELKAETVATAEEVMGYFTRVMRGEEKDQFGLDAPLSERTRAAQELAKRTIDIDNKKAGIADNTINVTLNWDMD